MSCVIKLPTNFHVLLSGTVGASGLDISLSTQPGRPKQFTAGASAKDVGIIQKKHTTDKSIKRVIRIICILVKVKEYVSY